MEYYHIPVLLDEVIHWLNPKPGSVYIDATLGGGGYTIALLEKVVPGGRVVSTDLDTEAIRNFKRIVPKKFAKASTVVHGNFRDIDAVVVHKKVVGIQGIVADLGLSSFELDQSGRGITFQKKELLDMRFDTSGPRETAAFMLNTYPESELEHIFNAFGEEPFARLIARGVVRRRTDTKLKYTTDLVEVVEQSIPRRVQFKAKDNIRRIFQAMRIAVNHELENLEVFLPKALELLSPGGRLVIVSFHSLEDRIVKQFFEKSSKGCICPPEFPVCICGKNPIAKILTKKPITAGNTELQANPRSKPAKLRVLEKI